MGTLTVAGQKDLAEAMLDELIACGRGAATFVAGGTSYSAVGWKHRVPSLPPGNVAQLLDQLGTDEDRQVAEERREAAKTREAEEQAARADLPDPFVERINAIAAESARAAAFRKTTDGRLEAMIEQQGRIIELLEAQTKRG